MVGAMKMIRILSLIGAAAWFTASAAQAQVSVPVNVGVSFTVLTQGASHDNGKVTTTRAPAPSGFTTRTLLTRLSDDFYGGTNFPAGSQLVYNGGGFSVIDRKGNVLVADTSSVLTLTVDTNVFWGTVQDTGTNTPPYSISAHDYATLNFDETGKGGTMKFTATGLGVVTETAGRANRAGNYRVSITGRFNLAGFGVNSTGAPIVLSGVVTGTGAATEGTP